MTSTSTTAAPARPATPPTRPAPTTGQYMARAFPLTLEPLEHRDANTPAGIITGYASVFDTIDSYGDVIQRGAFTRTLNAAKAKGKTIPVLWQHNPHEPIGRTLDITEDDHGLRIRAELLINDVEKAREAHALAAAGILGGLSIGFSIPKTTSAGTPGVTYDPDTDTHQIHEVRLWEYSLVTFPANEDATMTSVKHALAAAARATREATDALDKITEYTRELRAILDAQPQGAPAAPPALTIGAQTALLREAAQILRTGARHD